MIAFESNMNYQKKYGIVTKSHDDYAVVYYTGQEYILEKACVSLDDNILTINTGEKLVIKSGELLYITRTFQKVIKKSDSCLH